MFYPAFEFPTHCVDGAIVFIPIGWNSCPNRPEPAERHLVLSLVWSGAGAQPPALKTVRLERVSGFESLLLRH